MGLALGTPEMPTVGSVEHSVGNCKPCAFFHKQGCENGVQCKFCHLCDAGEKRRRQKEKKAQFRRSETSEEQHVDQQADVLTKAPVAVSTAGNEFTDACVNANTSTPAQELEPSSCSATEFGCKRLPKPAALDLDNDLDVIVPPATPQPWPVTPSDCWSPTPADNAYGVSSEDLVYLEPWGMASTMLPTPFVAPPVDEVPWLWQSVLSSPPEATPSVEVTFASTAPPLDFGRVVTY